MRIQELRIQKFLLRQAAEPSEAKCFEEAGVKNSEVKPYAFRIQELRIRKLSQMF